MDRRQEQVLSWVKLVVAMVSLLTLIVAWDLWKSNRALELMDPILGVTPPANVLLGYINIALLCVQESATDRPTRFDVFSMFNKEIALLPSP
ncbi:g-type lectin s-receptor-like serine/threonine-protein kinase [Quercus suber]|uniref:G-type lectin s-receptor-like serine/threonine-protein kinase n=1 Tax=Quercus suber TaxID=58331 RepID=A0AAW0M583_QUESU